MRSDLPINITTPSRIFLEGVYGYNSECTKISEFLERNKGPYKTREIIMKRGTERNKGIPYKHILVHLGCHSITKTKQRPFKIKILAMRAYYKARKTEQQWIYHFGK